MRVGYIAPTSILAVNGGVRTQALFTIEQVRKLGVETVLLSPWQNLSELNLDLVHIFTATEENIGISTQLKAQGIPFVLSPVFFANHSAAFINSILKFEKFTSLLGSGIRSGYKIKAEMCRQAGRLLPNTTKEAELIEKGFSIDKSKVAIIPNGVEERFAEASAAAFKGIYNLEDFILFVGQAGAPRKNVINLLKVASNVEEPVVIIGSFYDDDYGESCRAIIQQHQNIHHIETLNHNSEELASAYAAAKVFVLPSQYETPGIAALEAGLAGANIVITKYGGTPDYFGRFAEYIDPKSTVSLLNGIRSALAKEPSEHLKKYILSNFTWDKVAHKTVKQYKELLA